ncbi:hypothetical protein [uncultured Croceitalea sp.]|uniref:hypothetical protein n=1 Tax=uncultured Croceitalea sp. TaxID=1798908 RepID=UPI0033058D1F
MSFFALMTIVLLCSSELSAQEISTFPGFFRTKYYQDDKEITRKEVKELLLNNDGSATYWKKSGTNEALFYGTYTVFLVGAGWLGYELSKDEADRDLTAPTVVTLGGFLIAMIFYNGANTNARKAILTYNKQFDGKQTSFRLVPVGNADGLGLALRF